jgi:hypothetical protein
MKTISHKFIELIPDKLEDGIIYISNRYSTAVHKCCCGCQEEVVTPLSPTDWKLIFNGKSISLYPSIGNWSFNCKSHYWIRNNRVIWAKKWSKKEINDGRNQEYLNKRGYYDKVTLSSKKDINAKYRVTNNNKLKDFWLKLKKWCS